MQKLKNNNIDIEIKEYCYLDEACVYVALGWEPIEDYLKVLPEFQYRYNDFDKIQELLCEYYTKIENIRFNYQQLGAIDVCDTDLPQFKEKFKQEYKILLNKEKSTIINTLYNQNLRSDGVRRNKAEKIHTLSMIFALRKMKGLVAEMEDSIKPWQNKINELEENNPYIKKIFNAKKELNSLFDNIK